MKKHSSQDMKEMIAHCGSDHCFTLYYLISDNEILDPYSLHNIKEEVIEEGSDGSVHQTCLDTGIKQEIKQEPEESEYDKVGPLVEEIFGNETIEILDAGVTNSQDKGNDRINDIQELSVAPSPSILHGKQKFNDWGEIIVE